jgi:hypothetical protein
VTSIQTLLDQTALTARFHPGKTAVGHRWDLIDADDQLVGQTRRVHSGGAAGQLFWKTVSFTGMDAGNDIIADVLDASGTAVARLASRSTKARVDVTAPGGVPLGTVRRVKGEGLILEQPDGQLVGRVPIAKDAKAPWPLQDAAGTALGAVTLTPAKRVAALSLLAMAGLPDVFEPSRNFKRTMHLGFAHSKEYGVVMDQLPAAEPLRTLAVLLPVICGLAY